jgi:hypothetical protein
MIHDMIAIALSIVNTRNGVPIPTKRYALCSVDGNSGSGVKFVFKKINQESQ